MNPLDTRAVRVLPLVLERREEDGEATKVAQVAFTAFPEQGTWYALLDGYLLAAPMEKDGEPEMEDEGDDSGVNACDVAWGLLDPETEIECLRAERELLRSALRALVPMFDNDSPLLTAYAVEIAAARNAIRGAQ